MNIDIANSENMPPDGEYSDELPASYRIKDDLVPATHPDVDLIAQEFDLTKLHNMMRYLWMAGRPVPPRSLHHQVLLQREIVITERMDMHLIWGQGRIFLKPIPRFLLNPKFWEDCLSCRQDHSCKDVTQQPCVSCRLRECSLGFLVSYTALIAHESDYYIAIEKHLIPLGVSWKQWRLFVRRLLTSSSKIQSEVADRFVYGELRLNRLNLIYFFLGNSFVGYLPRWNSYGSFASDNFQLIIVAMGYFVIILSAMQVGLSTTQLTENESFQAASYGLTVFSILGPLAAIGLVILIFLVLFLVNWAKTWQGLKERERHLGRTLSSDHIEMDNKKRTENHV